MSHKAKDEDEVGLGRQQSLWWIVTDSTTTKKRGRAENKCGTSFQRCDPCHLCGQYLSAPSGLSIWRCQSRCCSQRRGDRCSAWGGGGACLSPSHQRSPLLSCRLQNVGQGEEERDGNKRLMNKKRTRRKILAQTWGLLIDTAAHLFSTSHI